MKLDQTRMPFVEALEAYAREGFVPFHTPGHKLGIGAPDKLHQWLGETLRYDLGVMYALDDLHEPEGVLKEAQELAADLYGADRTWFSINGTTAVIEAMILGTVREGEEIIIPREAHRSVISGLVLSGAKPVYLEGIFDEQWGIQRGAAAEQLEAVIRAHPKARAVLLVHPNYYGLGLDIRAMVSIAHQHGLPVLVDEAHGPHLPFDESLPTEAVAAGADLVAQSTHKLTGSLTQTSMLHGQGSRIDWRRVTQAHQMLQSTSPNYIFLASLDMARHQLAMEGRELVGKSVILARQLRQELAEIKGIRIMTGENIKGLPPNSLDCTKILIDFRDIGLTGPEAEKELRRHHIEVELTAGWHVLVLITAGDTEASIAALADAVRQVAAAAGQETDAKSGHKAAEDRTGAYHHQQGAALPRKVPTMPAPQVTVTPRQAYQARRKAIPLERAAGYIAAETITYYPPGIPFFGLGEQITPEVLDYIKIGQAAGYTPNGAADPTLQTLQVVDEEK